MLRVLQAPVMENYSYDALDIFTIQLLEFSQFSVVKEANFVRLSCEKGVILASPPHVVHQDFLYPPTYTKVAGCGFLSITQAGQFFLKYKLFSTGKHVKENRSELG